MKKGKTAYDIKKEVLEKLRRDFGCEGSGLVTLKELNDYINKELGR